MNAFFHPVLRTAVVSVCFAAVFSLAQTASAAGDPASAKGAPKATFIKGDVQVLRDGAAASSRVKRNETLPVGSLLKTGDSARAELTFADGSVVRVGPNSELKIDGAGYANKTKEVKVEATLVAGKAWAKVAKLVGDEATFQLKTQNAVAGVRGTVFRVNVDKDEATVVKVYSGAVAVAAPLLAAATPAKGEDVNTPMNADKKQIAPPFQEVTVKDFEHLLGKMMQVRVTKAGGVKAATPEAFTQEQDEQEEPAWVRWNAARDAGKDTERSD